MTKEEFKKEAEKYIKQNYCEMCIMADDCKSGCIDCFTVQAYITGAEPREKHIEELEAQIERMKCCGNCENRCGQEECANCHNYSKWKFKQAEQFYEEIVE